jgi:glutaminyl-peptide cyclotransferase
MKTRWFGPRHGTPLILAALALAACGRHVQGEVGDVPPSPAPVAGDSSAVRYGYEKLHEWPHDPTAFTQGLVFLNGDLLESTGLNGQSTLRDVDLETGKVLRQVRVPSQYFAEGLAVIGSKAYQLTWKSRKGFIYDVATFNQTGEFPYEGEGWGLTTDGRLLVLSDGTSRIRFIDPDTFKVVRSIDVRLEGRPLGQLNELEWIKGEIFANVWQTDTVVRIDPATGTVRGIIDFSFLLPLDQQPPGTDVLNGIAYDPAHDRLYVTGKRWPLIFEVRLKPRLAP